MTHAGPYCLQVDACDLAASSGSEVQHPLLDKVRLCSANPDQAASFFLHLFHPVPHKRIAAVDHAWTASTTSRMHDEMGLSCSTSAAEGRWSKFKQGCTRGLCAFMPCCGGRSPTLESETHLTGSRSHPHSATRDGDLSCSFLSEMMPSLRSNQDKTSQSAADTDMPESVQSKADSMQTDPTALQSCWNKVKRPFAGRSKHHCQRVNKGVTHPIAEAAPGAVEVVAADKSVLAPAADEQQQVLIRAVTLTAVPGSPSGLEVQDLQQHQQAISNSGQGLLSHKEGKAEQEEVLTDHEAAAGVRRHSSSEEQLQQPAQGRSAESMRLSLLSTGTTWCCLHDKVCCLPGRSVLQHCIHCGCVTACCAVCTCKFDVLHTDAELLLLIC